MTKELGQKSLEPPKKAAFPSRGLKTRRDKIFTGYAVEQFTVQRPNKLVRQEGETTMPHKIAWSQPTTMIFNKKTIFALLISSASADQTLRRQLNFDDSTCAKSAGCILWDKTAKVEMALKTEVELEGTNDKNFYCPTASDRGWSVRCDTDYGVDNDKVLNEIKFYYIGEDGEPKVQDEYGEPRWMNGDDDPSNPGDDRWINDVHYLVNGWEEKNLRIEGRIWTGTCFEAMYKLTPQCDGDGGATDAPTVGPTVAPTGTPTDAPTMAPTAGPTVAPTAGPTGAPTAGPTVAPTGTPCLPKDNGCGRGVDCCEGNTCQWMPDGNQRCHGPCSPTDNYCCFPENKGCGNGETCCEGTTCQYSGSKGQICVAPTHSPTGSPTGSPVAVVKPPPSANCYLWTSGMLFYGYNADIPSGTTVEAMTYTGEILSYPTMGAYYVWATSNYKKYGKSSFKVRFVLPNGVAGDWKECINYFGTSTYPPISTKCYMWSSKLYFGSSTYISRGYTVETITVVGKKFTYPSIGSNYVYANDFRSYDSQAFHLRFIDSWGRPGPWKKCVNYTPIALDVDKNGAVEHIEGEFIIDITGDGEAETLEQWFAPTDGILIDTKHGLDSDTGIITGHHLFGDMGRTYLDGYEKLELLDANGDGLISGDELDGLAIWIDSNSNALLDDGEMSSLESHDIVSLSTVHENFISVATLGDGSTIIMEDKWFVR